MDTRQLINPITVTFFDSPERPTIAHYCRAIAMGTATNVDVGDAERAMEDCGHLLLLEEGA